MGTEDYLTLGLPFGTLRLRFGTSAEGEDCKVLVEDAALDLLVFLEALEVAGGFTNEPASEGIGASTATVSATSSEKSAASRSLSLGYKEEFREKSTSFMCAVRRATKCSAGCFYILFPTLAIGIPFGDYHDASVVALWSLCSGAVIPSVAGMEHYDPTMAYSIQSPGLKGNHPDIVVDTLSVHGLRVVHPIKVFYFYNELHAYLASCGVYGVKVDIQI
uniref:uncharacterized protein LOC122595412 n=1 Tax=Erigeron canadensis TaxID=72917 RepID=UPI001CB8C94F|nr:uncharacterized protein LOC122595412 [Erigeron canadensis]